MDKMRYSKRRKQARTISRYHRAEFFVKTGMPLCVFTAHGEPDSLFHDHDFTELVVVLGGSGMHLAASKLYPIQAGDVFVIHENTGHAYQDTHNLEIINVLFDLNQLDLPVKDLVSLELLAAGELNVTEAAFRVGFTDSNYFARQFRKHMGLSPGNFRRQAVVRASTAR